MVFWVWMRNGGEVLVAEEAAAAAAVGIQGNERQ